MAQNLQIMGAKPQITCQMVAQPLWKLGFSCEGKSHRDQNFDKARGFARRRAFSDICHVFQPFLWVFLLIRRANTWLQTSILDRTCSKKSHIDMPRRLPPLNALRAFEAAGRHESFTGAAQELNVSHSAISKHVRGLEDRLGAQLFSDLSRGVALTDPGRRYLAALTPAFDTIAEATEEFSDRPAGTVRVNGETVFVIKWLIPHLHDFYEKHPEIELEIDASAQFANIERYEADIAIRFFLSGRLEPGAVLLSDAPLYPVATPEIAAKVNGKPENLLSHRLLRDRGGETWPDWFEEIGRPDIAQKLSPTRRLRAMVAIEMVLAGQGVLLSSYDNVKAEVAAGRLVQLFDTRLQQGCYGLLFGAGVLRRKPVRVFRDWLLEQTAEFRASGENQPIG